MITTWSLVPIGDVANRIERSEVPTPGKQYRQIGVRLWGQGAYEREILDGAQTKYQTLFRVESSDIIVNKIWARNGSVAVVTNELSGCYGSGEFPIFCPNRDQLNPRWFHWITKTSWFWRECDLKSRGTSGKNRIRPEKFLEIQIPLPPVEEQQQIVAKIDDLAAKIEEAHRLRQITLQEVMALVASRRAQLMNQARKFEEKVFDKAVEQIRGSSGLPLKEYQSTGRYPVIDQGQRFIAGYCDDERRLLHLPEAVVVWGDHTTNVKLIDFNFVPGADGTKVFVPKEGISAPFLFHFLKSVNFPDLGYSRHYRYLKQVLIPVPQSAEQRRIVAELDALQTKAEGFRQLQAQTAAELDALLPSILDKAFKGEL